jgi:acyl carrier protein
MGLDLVEIIAVTEQEFNIIIPDEVAVQLMTPRKLIDHVHGNSNLAREFIAEKIMTIIENETAQTDFNEDSHFIDDMHLS